MTPLVRRTWAPKGKTPVFYRCGRNLKKISVIGALCLKQRKKPALYFRLLQNINVTSARCLDFLHQLRLNIRGNIIVLWDRLPAHRTKKIKRFVKRHKRISLHYFPPYAPEINPAEYVWGHVKHNPLCQFAPQSVLQLARTTKKAFHQLKYKPSLLQSFANHSPLTFF